MRNQKPISENCYERRGTRDERRNNFIFYYFSSVVPRLSSVMIVFFLMLVVLKSGCGYTNKAILPHNIRSIAVPIFANQIPPQRMYTYQSGLESTVASEVRRQLIFDGNVRVVEESKADAVLEGVLTAYEQEPYRFNTLEGVDEYRLYVQVTLRLRDRRTGEIVWEEPSFTGQGTYFLSGARASSQADATRKAIKNLAENIVNRIVEDW